MTDQTHEERQELADAGVDIRVIGVDQIAPNEYNPNEMPPEYFEVLTDTIKSEGMKQPVLVREDPDNEDGYIMVDGQHRWEAAKIAGLENIAVVVVDYDDTMAKVRTLSFNQLRGQNIPIKLARVIVDLQKEYSDAEIRRMTGVAEDEQESVLKLLEVPDFSLSGVTGQVNVSQNEKDTPIPVNLLLLPADYQSYTKAMKQAMNFAGEDVVALVGNEVEDYNKAMSKSMGLAGIKLRNVALSTIIEAFLEMPEEQQAKTAERVRQRIMDKRMKDAEAKQAAKEKSDHHVTEGGARKRNRGD